LYGNITLAWALYKPNFNLITKMKNLLGTLFLMAIIGFTACKKAENFSTDDSAINSAANTKKKKADTYLDYVYISNTGTTFVEDNQSYDNVKVYRTTNSGLNLRVYLICVYFSDKGQDQFNEGPSTVYLGATNGTEQFFNLSDVVYTNKTPHSLGGTYTESFKFTIDRIENADTGQDITSQIGIIPEEGIMANAVHNAPNSENPDCPLCDFKPDTN
jgi:hypothetical protein